MYGAEPASVTGTESSDMDCPRRRRPVIGFLTSVATNGLIRLFAKRVPPDLRDWYITTQFGEADELADLCQYRAQLRYVLGLRHDLDSWSPTSPAAGFGEE